MSKFAFQVSWPDLIRKIGYRYEHPVDYLSSLIARFYDPGARVDITVEPLRIEVRSDSLIPASLFDLALNGSPLDSTFVIPPVIEYSAVRILSGLRGIVVDSQRAVHRADPESFLHGTVIAIQRVREPRIYGDQHLGYDVGTTARLEHLYWGSDLRVTVNGRALYVEAYRFKTGALEGTVSYDATHEGGIRYYSRGRFVEGERFIDGVDLLVHRHSFRTTLTSSHIIKTGEEHLQMERQLPGIMAGYLESPFVSDLTARNPHSCSVLCQTILARFPEDERLRELAGRLTRPKAGSLVGPLIHPEAGNSAGHSGSSRSGGSSGRPSLRLKIMSLCAAAVLCLGFWMHSAGIRPPAGAPSAPISARPPAETASPSVSRPDPGRPAPVSPTAPGDSMSIPPSSRGRSNFVPGVAELPGESGSTPNLNPASPVPGSVGAPGAIVDSQPAVRTGQGFSTPSGNLPAAHAPGLAYGTSSALAEDLQHMEEHAAKSGTSHEGYLPESTFNVLTMSGGHLSWSKRPPYDSLVDGVEHPVTSPELANVSGHADGIRAVRSYLNGFEYGSIPLEVGRRYPDELSALLGERKADCTSSNTLAAHLLFGLGYRKVAAVSGTRGGCPHMWLSVWEDGQWQIEDFTPSRLSPDFAQACLAHSVSPPMGSNSQGSTGQDSTGQDSTGQDSTGQDSTGQDSTGQGSTGQGSTGQGSTGQGSTGQGSTGQGWPDVPAGQQTRTANPWGTSAGFPGASGRSAAPWDGTDSSHSGIGSLFDGLIDPQTSAIFFNLCALLAIVCLAYSGISFMLRKRAMQAAANNCSALAESVRDLLGVALVDTGKEAAYDPHTRTLTLNNESLSGNGPFVSAVKAVPLISTGEAHQQALYQRLADRAVR